jgi:hypothetical protein
MKLSIPEILDQVVAAPGKTEKILVLQKLNNPTLQQILRLNFDPAVELDLPAGPAPYNARRDIPVELSDSNLYNEARRLYIFEPGHPKYNPNVKKMQKENIWIQILEGCHHTEADLLNLVKDKKLSSAYKGLTEALVREAFPGLLSEKVSKK